MLYLNFRTSRRVLSTHTLTQRIAGSWQISKKKTFKSSTKHAFWFPHIMYPPKVHHGNWRWNLIGISPSPNTIVVNWRLRLVVEVGWATGHTPMSTSLICQPCRPKLIIMRTWFARENAIFHFLRTVPDCSVTVIIMRIHCVLLVVRVTRAYILTLLVAFVACTCWKAKKTTSPWVPFWCGASLIRTL